MDIVKNFYVNERTDSDHMSLSLEIEEEDYIRNKKEKEEDNREEVQDIQERRKKTCWSKEHKRAYRNKMELIDVEMEKKENIEIRWQKIREIIQDSMFKEERGRGKKRDRIQRLVGQEL